MHMDAHRLEKELVREQAGYSPTSSRDLRVFTDPSNGMPIDIQKASACRYYSVRTICHPAQCEQNTS